MEKKKKDFPGERLGQKIPGTCHPMLLLKETILLSSTFSFLPFKLSRDVFCSPAKSQEVGKVSLVSMCDVLFNHPSVLHSEYAIRIAQSFSKL